MFVSCGSVIVRSNPPKARPHKSLFRSCAHMVLGAGSE